MKTQGVRRGKRRAKRWKAPTLAKDVCVKVVRKGYRTRAFGSITRLVVTNDTVVGVYYRLANMNECYALVANVTVDRVAEKRRQAREAERAKQKRASSRPTPSQNAR